jgi:hypothetical protein
MNFHIGDFHNWIKFINAVHMKCLVIVLFFGAAGVNTVFVALETGQKIRSDSQH